MLLIDADGLIYHSSKGTIEESIVSLNERIDNIFQKTKETEYLMFISVGKYFRHDVSADYKAQRKKSPLKWLKTLKQYLIENYGAFAFKGVEADDLVAYFYSNNFYEYVNGNCEKIICDDATATYEGIISKQSPIKMMICTPDKDILQAYSGTHFNYSYKEDSKGFFVNTINSNDKFTLYQLIAGDPSDNIKGIEGKGKAFFNKLLEENPNLNYSDILNEYINVYGVSQGIYNFQKNYRLVHLLSKKEDYLREVGWFPNLLKIRMYEKNIDDYGF